MWPSLARLIERNWKCYEKILSKFARSPSLQSKSIEKTLKIAKYISTTYFVASFRQHKIPVTAFHLIWIVSKKIAECLLNFMFESSWTDAILSSLLWFFYHPLNGSSEYIRPNPQSRSKHFAQKRPGIICFSSSQVVSPPANESGSKFRSREKSISVFWRWESVREEMKMC